MSSASNDTFLVFTHISDGLFFFMLIVILMKSLKSFDTWLDRKKTAKWHAGFFKK
jgi:hypothetical protein